jgi:vanillate O-demethylase monooxygenase subunit
MFAPLLPGHPNAVQKSNFIRWMAPSNLLLQTGVAMPGVPREKGTGYWVIHFLTPETDATTHYHFTAVRWNVQTKGEALNRELIDKIGAGRLYAFAEQDAPVIEAQQAAIDQSPDPVDMTMLSIDVGPMRYKRILERLIREEERGIPAPV